MRLETVQNSLFRKAIFFSLIFFSTLLFNAQGPISRILPIKFKKFDVTLEQRKKIINGYWKYVDSVNNSKENEDSFDFKPSYLVYRILTKRKLIKKIGVYSIQINARHNPIKMYFIKTSNDIIIIQDTNKVYLKEKVIPILKSISFKNRKSDKIYNRISLSD